MLRASRSPRPRMIWRGRLKVSPEQDRFPFSALVLIMRTLFRKLGQVGWSFPIILTLLALCVASLFAITSATSSNEALKNAPLSQSYYIIAGFVVYLAVALTPYQTLVKA